MKRYNVVFNENQEEGVYAISVVESPAMESMFLTLSKQDKKPSLSIELKESEEGKKENILLGVALIPDKPVYRNQNGEEFEIIFSKDTIKKAAHNFLKMGYQHNSSVEHETPINGVSIVESWLVKDANNDAANAYGLAKEDIVEGAWIVKMKCDNKEIYDKAVSGEIKGFSIDGLFDLEEVQLNSNITMSEEKKSLKDKLIAFATELFKDEPKEIKLGTAKLKGGEVTIEFEGEMFAIGDQIMVVDGENRVPAPQGKHELEDGRVLVLDENGVVLEILDTNSMQEEEEVAMNDEVKGNALDLDAIKSMLVKFKEEADKKLEVALSTQKETLTKEFEVKLSAQKADFDKQVLELGKQPAAKPIKSAPTAYKKGESIVEFLNKRKA